MILNKYEINDDPGIYEYVPPKKEFNFLLIPVFFVAAVLIVLLFKVLNSSLLIGLGVVTGAFLLGKKLKMPYTREDMDRSSMFTKLILLTISIMMYAGMLMVVFGLHK